MKSHRTSTIGLTLAIAALVGCGPGDSGEGASSSSGDPTSGAGASGATSSSTAGSGAATSGTATGGSTSTSSGGPMCGAYSQSCHGAENGKACWDYYGDLSQMFAQTECSTDGGSLDTTMCDTTGSHGGCRHPLNIDACGVRWDFDPAMTEADVETTCGKAKGTYLPP